MEKRLELLAPAGSFESLKAAVHAGADAVYMGGSRFGARAYADNPEGEALLQAIDYAHLYGVKLYLTVNTLLKEQELEQELYEYLLPCCERGLDAVIVQDLGVLQAVREWFPELPVHASTQMTLCGTGGARILKEAGAQRIVLARELSLPEIARIHEDTGMEIECFVHGALCYCYSGQCLFSSILGGRSGNRGRCAQPCRLTYEALSEQGPVTRKGPEPLLSPKDICTIDLLPKIARAGVYSLKIEGRMKRPEYTAGVVRIYRKYVDWYLQYGGDGYRVLEEDKKELLLLFNRDGFSRGYYEKHNGRELMALAAQKPDRQEKKAYEVLTAGLRRDYVEKEKKIPVTGTLYAEAGQPMRLKIKAGPCVTVYGDSPQTPKNRPMDPEQLYRQMNKTGGTPFIWKELKIRMEGPLFIPVQALNQLRREGFSKLQEEILGASRRNGPGCGATFKESASAGADSGRQTYVPSWKNGAELHVSVETPEQLGEVLSRAEDLRAGNIPLLCAVYIDAESMEEDLEEQIGLIHEKHLKAYVMLPVVFRMKTAERYEKEKDRWALLPAEGCVIRNLEEYTFLKEIGWKGEIILDHNVYTFNRRSRAFWREKGIRGMTSPLELNRRELSEISDRDSIQIIYGRYPMMVTAGCIHRTLGQCRQKPELWMLKDRYQKEFPVKNCCRDCYNIIYNSQPLYLADLMDELPGPVAGAYRVMFTTERREEVRRVLMDLAGQKKRDRDFTRGHFKRGVE